MLFFIESTLRKEENILKKFFQKKVKNLNHFKEGCIALKDAIAPSYINVKNPKFIEIDNYYYAGLIISNYNRNVSDLILKKLIDTNINMNISLFYEKQDTYKTIRDLTYHIGNVSVDLQTIQKNRQDIDIAAFTYDDAKYIRREMQVNNEDLYFLYTYITIFSQNQKELKYLLTLSDNNFLLFCCCNCVLTPLIAVKIFPKLVPISNEFIRVINCSNFVITPVNCIL